MATTVKFFRDADGFFCGISFSDHARSEDNPDKSTGTRLCAAMSVLSSYVEALAECAAVDYDLNVEVVPPTRRVAWDRCFAMQTPVSALYNTVLSLAAQYPDFVKVETETLQRDE